MKFLIKILLPFLIPLTCYTQWYSQSSGIQNMLIDISFINNSTGYISGAEYVLKTTNGGNNWSVTFNYPFHIFRGIFFTDANTGYVLEGSKIYKTTNGGLNWFQQTSPSDVILDKIDFVNSNTGYIVGGTSHEGRLIKTTNGGTNWFYPGPNYFSYEFYSIDFIDANTGYFGGSALMGQGSGPIYKTTNGGVNFIRWMLSPPGHAITGISFCNYDSGYAVDDWSDLFKTTNGGINYGWGLSFLSGSTIDVTALKFDTVYVVGHSGFITRSINAGLTWEVQQSGISENLNQITFIGNDTGFIVGNHGTILKTTNGGVIGVEPISNQIPREFKLYQNYPNPFNPVTKIKFDITPLSSIGEGPGVRLAVYDILGNEIAVLVSKELKPGTYEVSWDASKYPSGVYFYRLQAGQYVDTKKLVLIK